MYTIIRKYQVPKLQSLITDFQFPDKRSRHTANIVWTYYHFAYWQMLALDTARSEVFGMEKPAQDEGMQRIHKSWSFAYGMYAQLRTVIEAMRIFRKMIGDTAPVEPYWEQTIKRITDIANDVVKHPMFKYGISSKGASPGSLDIGGNIDVTIVLDKGGDIKIALDPMEDFYSVRNYLEDAATRCLRETDHVASKCGSTPRLR